MVGVAVLLLHFKEKNVEITENHWNINCVLAKLVYVYEEVEPESPKSKRHKLINPHYFSGVHSGADNAKLWDEVYTYLNEKPNPPAMLGRME